MALSKTIRVIETFPAGTDVEAYAVATPVASFPPPGEPAASATVDDDGNVKFDGLEDNTQYVVVGEVPQWRQVSFYVNEATSTPDSTVVTPGTGTNPAAQGFEPNVITGDVQSLEAAGFDVEGDNVDAKPLNPDLPGEPEANPADPQALEEQAPAPAEEAPAQAPAVEQDLAPAQDAPVEESAPADQTTNEE